MATEARPVTPGATDSESVCVAVHIRPLIDLEHEQGCGECLEVTPGQSQVGRGEHRYTYDHVFGGDFGQDPETLYGRCVAPLVDGLFKGYNATVFAYGQTGSGKTYTMGSAFSHEGNSTYRGVIPQAMEAIFTRISEIQGSEFTIRVGFVEIHKEEIRDLLAKRHTSNVLIHSLGAVIAPVLGAGGSGSHLQGHALLAAAGTLLKQVAQQLNAAVLVTNHMVGGRSGGGAAGGSSVSGRSGVSGFENEFKRPALGESWSHQCHCRVQLSRPASDFSEGQRHPWTAVVRASTMLNPGKVVAQYWLGAAGASAIAPPSAQ